MKANRIAGLDTIRAISALWVVMGHIGAPPLTAGLDESNGLARVVVGIYANFWSGPAAVMVFFVISGFCILYPYARSLTVPSQKAYLVRRYCRIAVPLVIAVGISRMLSVNLSLFNLSILWSLVAELVYYTIYPLLLHARRATGSWMPLVICAFGLALALAATQPSAGNYPSFGNALNWLLGLPVWLSGCWLADRVVASKGPTAVSFGQIWVWRGAILVLATVCSILRYHSPIGYPWTLNLFGFAVVLWLVREIAWFMGTAPKRWLEWIGTWSYSIYLFHLLAVPIYSKCHVPNFGIFLNWTLLLCFVLFTSFLFYVAVEYPSHLLARRLGNACARSAPAGTTADRRCCQ